jgi:hypothetical protein
MVYNLKGDTSAAGLSDCRKILSRAVMAAIAPDICLFQESAWVVDKIMKNNIQHVISGRTWIGHGTMEACILWDVNMFAKVADYTTNSFLPTAPAYIPIPFCVRNAGLQYGVNLSKYGNISSRVQARNRIPTNGSLEETEALFAVFAVLERLAIVELADRQTGKSCIFASFHGHYIGKSPVEKNAFCEGALALVNEIAKRRNLAAICGGDFNHNLNELRNTENTFLIPTHVHSPRRTNLSDWIVITSPGILTDFVRAADVFPLPVRARYWVIAYRQAKIVGSDEETAVRIAVQASSAVPIAAVTDDYELFDLWADDRWKALAHVMNETDNHANILYETDNSSMFDHDPLVVEMQL